MTKKLDTIAKKINPILKKYEVKRDTKKYNL